MKKNIFIFILCIWAIFSSVCAIQNAHEADRNLKFWNHYEKVFHTYYDDYWQLRLRLDKDIDPLQ